MPRQQRTTTQRGYGSSHQAERARLEPTIQAGQGWCAEVICVMPTRWIRPGTPWHLAHSQDRSQWLGPSHERCNIAEVNRRRGNGKPRRKRAPRPSLAAATPSAWRTSRQW
jgi:hypothetical protein